MEVCGNALPVSDDIHRHCSNCFKIYKCTVRPTIGESCEIMSCEMECGARFHSCKRAEHKLLCSNEKVPCINAVNGCPIWLYRRLLGHHLQTCPASVVHCTMEWNRWPVCSRERQMHIPFHQPNPNARAGQLDVALALRDQRMLNEWLRAPRRARRAMRNSLTRRFPAVPVQMREPVMVCYGLSSDPSNDGSENSSQQSRTVTDDEEDTPWEARKAPPGLQRSVCGELYRASKQTTESLTAALNMITNNHNGHRPVVSLDMEKDTNQGFMEWLDSYVDKENICSMANGCALDKNRQRTIAENVEAMDVEKISSSKERFSETTPLKSGPVEVMDFGLDTESGEEVVELPGGYDVLFVDHTVVSEISSASMTDHARKQPSVVPPVPPPPPPTSPPLFVNLGLDLTLESITRYQEKPKSMYTFLCAQEFRRDEYGWHYKNVHSDIHGGLNGWLEQRCPLAHYGCMFSVRRFYPTSCGSSIVHNDILESFGVQPFISWVPSPQCVSQSSPMSSIRTSPERKPSRRTPPPPPPPPSSHVISNYKHLSNSSTSHPIGIIHEDGASVDVSLEKESSTSPLQAIGEQGGLLLMQLPFEVLQHVARFLDSFSLCNLSMTSRLFREVCCSLLEERGIVVQQWERVKCGKRSSWRIAYKVGKFFPKA